MAAPVHAVDVGVPAGARQPAVRRRLRVLPAWRGCAVKRGKPPQRKTELKRGKRLERGSAELKRSGPLRPVSKKRQRENRERRAMVNERWPGGVRPRCIVPWCTNLADDLHEPLTRARGGSITDPDNTVPVCRRCHDEIGAEPAWAYRLVLLVRSTDKRSPARLAAARRKALASESSRRAA